MHTRFFHKTLQTDQGKKYARERESDYNAQSVYKNQSAFLTKSNNDRFSVSAALIYVTSSKIKSLKGTAEVFMLHWQD